jgi:hypothetical protein
MVVAVTQRGITFYVGGSRQEEFVSYLSILGNNSTWTAQLDFIRDSGRNQIVITDNVLDLPATIRASAYRNVYSGIGGEVGAATLDPQGSSNAFVLFNVLDGYVTSGDTTTYRSGFSTFVHEIYHIGYTGTAQHPSGWLGMVNRQLEEFGIVGEAQMQGRLTFDHTQVARPTLDLSAPQSSDIPVRRDDPASTITHDIPTEDGWVLAQETINVNGRQTSGLEVQADNTSILSQYGYTAAGVQYLDAQTATVETLADSGWTTTVVATDYTVNATGATTGAASTVTVGTGASATPTIFTGNAIGGIFGSAIGQAIGGGNVFASVGAQAGLSTVLGTVGHSLHIYFNDTHLSNVAGSAAATLEESVAVALNGVGSALGSNLLAAGSGAISSFLTAELAQTLGFNTTTFGGNGGIERVAPACWAAAQTRLAGHPPNRPVFLARAVTKTPGCPANDNGAVQHAAA